MMALSFVIALKFQDLPVTQVWKFLLAAAHLHDSEGSMILLGCVRVSSGVRTDATTLNNVGTRSASWEGYNP